MEEYDLNRLDKFLIIGHVPVMNLNDDESNHIYRATGYMCIDTGASFVEKVVLCLAIAWKLMSRYIYKILIIFLFIFL